MHATASAPRFTLVLGAGGTVGLAYHAGVLKALSDVGGIECTAATLESLGGWGSTGENCDVA